MLKCTKVDFGWGSAPDPAGGAHGAPADLPSWILGAPTSKQRERRGKEKTRKEGQKGRAGEEATKWERKGKGETRPQLKFWLRH